MADRYSPEYPREGPSAAFSASADIPAGAGWIAVEVEHRDGPEDAWSMAGRVAEFVDQGEAWSILGCLKAVVRMTVTVVGSLSPFDVSLEEPKWLPLGRGR